MTFATRCHACGTTFRVVQDQLRVSDGWVRCGRCDTVFDALDHLVDLDPPTAATAGSAARQRDDRPDRDGGAANIDIRQLLERHDQDPVDLPAAVAAPPAPADEPDADPPADEAAAPTGISIDPADGSGVQAEPAEPTNPVDAPAAPAADLSAPSFMRDDDRSARLESPAMRAALLGSSLIMLLMLVMQVVYQQRDSIAASSPAAAALLRGACERWNCRIEPVRRIADLSIESSALSKIAGKPDSVALTLSVRNRGPEVLALPAVDLSLTDVQGKVIARKALLPQDFRIDTPQIDGATVLPLRLVLSTGATRIAGYTVELFYP